MCRTSEALVTRFKYKQDIYENINIVLVFINDERFSDDNTLDNFIAASRENISENLPYIFIIKKSLNDNLVIKTRGISENIISLEQYYNNHDVEYWRNYSWDYEYPLPYIFN